MNASSDVIMFLIYFIVYSNQFKNKIFMKLPMENWVTGILAFVPAAVSLWREIRDGYLFTAAVGVCVMTRPVYTIYQSWVLTTHAAGARITHFYGELAHSAEHCPCKAEVTGAKPVFSTETRQFAAELRLRWTRR